MRRDRVQAGSPHSGASRGVDSISPKLLAIRRLGSKCGWHCRGPVRTFMLRCCMAMSTGPLGPSGKVGGGTGRTTGTRPEGHPWEQAGPKWDQPAISRGGGAPRAAANILGLTWLRDLHVDSALIGTGMVGTGGPLKDA